MDKKLVMHGFISPPIWWNNPDPVEPAERDDLPVSDTLWGQLMRWSEHMEMANPLSMANPQDGYVAEIEVQQWVAEGHELWLRLRQELGPGYSVAFWPGGYDMRLPEEYPLPQ